MTPASPRPNSGEPTRRSVCSGRRRASDDATATDFGDRHAVPARLGRDGQRRVRVGVLAGSGRYSNPRKLGTASFGVGNERRLRAGTAPKAGVGFGEGHRDGRETVRPVGRPANYLGLVPGDYSSWESQRGGALTKAGNSPARRVLVEAAWHYSRKLKRGKDFPRP